MTSVEKFAQYAVDLNWPVYRLTKTGRLYQSWYYSQLDAVGKKMDPTLDRRERIHLAVKFLDANRRKINAAVKQLLTSSSD